MMDNNIAKVLYFFCSEGASKINSGEDTHTIILNPFVTRKLKLPKLLNLCTNGSIDINQVQAVESICIKMFDPEGDCISDNELKDILLKNLSEDILKPTIEFSLTLSDGMLFEIPGFYELQIKVNGMVIGSTGFYIHNVAGDDND